MKFKYLYFGATTMIEHFNYLGHLWSHYPVASIACVTAVASAGLKTPP